jgi:hypothetical protein
MGQRNEEIQQMIKGELEESMIADMLSNARIYEFVKTSWPHNPPDHIARHICTLHPHIPMTARWVCSIHQRIIAKGLTKSRLGYLKEGASDAANVPAP